MVKMVMKYGDEVLKEINITDKQYENEDLLYRIIQQEFFLVLR